MLSCDEMMDVGYLMLQGGLKSNGESDSNARTIRTRIDKNAKVQTHASIRRSMRSRAQSMNNDPKTTVDPLSAIMPTYDPWLSRNSAPAAGPPANDLMS